MTLMTQRLRDLMKKKMATEGSQGRVRMALSIERTERMVSRYLNGKSTPRPEIAYKLAKACGVGDEEALSIAEEFSPHRAKDSA